jgi:hypothetical protein
VVFDSLMNAFDRGLQTGQTREPIAAGEPDQAATFLKLAELLTPLGHRVLDRMMQPKRAAVVTPPAASPPPAPGAAPATAEPEKVSSAEVIEPESSSAARWITAIDQLAEAAGENSPVDEIADDLERILPVDELAGALEAGNEAVIGEITSRAGGRYPVFLSEAGRAYIARVLDELRKDDSPAA